MTLKILLPLNTAVDWLISKETSLWIRSMNCKLHVVYTLPSPPSYQPRGGRRGCSPSVPASRTERAGGWWSSRSPPRAGWTWHTPAAWPSGWRANWRIGPTPHSASSPPWVRVAPIEGLLTFDWCGTTTPPETDRQTNKQINVCMHACVRRKQWKLNIWCRRTTDYTVSCFSHQRCERESLAEQILLSGKLRKFLLSTLRYISVKSTFVSWVHPAC